VPERCSFDYALLRVVPRVEREECINAGVVLYCAERAYLGARIELDERRLLALMPHVTEEELAEIRAHLAAIPLVAAGGPAAGPIGQLGQAQRFHWLVAPRSTMVQPGPVHSGLCESPEVMLEHLLATMVRVPKSLQE
jgi:hypothetical protein